MQHSQQLCSSWVAHRAIDGPCLLQASDEHSINSAPIDHDHGCVKVNAQMTSKP